MKRASSLFTQIIEWKNFEEAFYKSGKKKRLTSSYLIFRNNYQKKLNQLRRSVVDNSYKMAPYRQFVITDPKKRIISAAAFKDRIVHHAIMNILEPIFEKQFIYHTYACRKDKGTHAAIRALENKAHDDLYFIKLDVRKYFDNINHEILKNQLCKIIKDKKCLQLLFGIIDSYKKVDSTLLSTSILTGLTTGNFDSNNAKGLPIGNLTSQFFANFYLSCFDHFVLEELKPFYYIRYMDDMVILVKERQAVNKNLTKIENFLKNKLYLQIKPPVISKCSSGIPFLGRLIFHRKHVLLRSKQKRKNNKIGLINWLYANDYISLQKACDRILCVLADS